MIYDKRKGSLLNYIQLPLHVITENGTFLGTGYDDDDKPTYILSHVKVNLENVKDLTFSTMSKDAIILDNNPTLTVENNIVGYAETGVDYISIGAITKHINAIDLSLQFD